MSFFLKYILILCTLSAEGTKVKVKLQGPRAEYQYRCEHFSRGARFNPLSIVNEPWFVFYTWGAIKFDFFTFYALNSRMEHSLKMSFPDEFLDAPMNWTAQRIAMVHDRSTFLLVENNQSGHYWMYDPIELSMTSKNYTPVEVRFKQNAGFIGFMNCNTSDVLLMSRLLEIPSKDKMWEAVSRIQYRGSHGRSYLNRGNEWMPIPDADDQELQNFIAKSQVLLAQFKDNAKKGIVVDMVSTEEEATNIANDCTRTNEVLNSTDELLSNDNKLRIINNDLEDIDSKDKDVEKLDSPKTDTETGDTSFLDDLNDISKENKEKLDVSKSSTKLEENHITDPKIQTKLRSLEKELWSRIVHLIYEIAAQNI